MFIHNLLALVHDANGEFEKAKTHLNLAKEIVRHTGSLYFEFLFLLTEAHFALERQKKDEGLKLLQKAFAVGRKWGVTDTSMPHFWQPTVLARLCKEALEAGIEVEYVRKLIRDSHLIPESPPVEIDNWPWPLRIYTLGRFELERDGEPVRFSGKVQHKPLLLLKALIALGGQEVPEEQIADSLWPKSEGDLAHSAFTSTLSRLRRLLGRDDFIRFQEGKAILDPRVCWVDAWSFEKLLEKAAAVWKSPRFQEKKINMALMAKTSVLYKGHFLPHDEEHSWTFSMRERLRSKFHGLMERLGGQLQQNGAWEEAAEHYQKALEIDNLEEEFYRQLMVCYLRLGRHAEAVQAYYRCKKTLATILGVDPSPKTEALYRTLKGEGRTNH